MAHILVNIPGNESDFSACHSVESSIGSKMTTFFFFLLAGSNSAGKVEHTIKTTKSDIQF